MSIQLNAANDDVAFQVFCNYCQQYVYGEDIRFLKRPGTSRWVTVEVEWQPPHNYFAVNINGWNTDIQNNQNEFRRFFDLRQTCLGTHNRSFTLNLMTDHQGNNVGFKNTRSGVEVDNWHVLVQDLCTQHEVNVMNIASFPGFDPANDRPMMQWHQFECCLYERNFFGNVQHRLFFQRPPGHGPLTVPPDGATHQDTRYNRCFNHMLMPKTPPYAQMHRFHVCSPPMLDMRYGLNRRHTRWVDVRIDQSHYQQPTQDVNPHMLFVTRLFTGRGSDDDWFELQGCAPFIGQGSFFMFNAAVAGSVWRGDYGFHRCRDWAGNGGSNDGWASVLRDLLTPPGQGLAIIPRPGLFRSIRRVWDDAIQEFTLAIEHRNQAE